MDDSSPVAGPGGTATSGDPVAQQRQLTGDVSAVPAELRRSTAELAERLDAVAQQLDGLGPLREQVQQLAARVDAIDVPSADTVATAVSGQVGRIVDGLAPRVADVVLARVAAVLVDQLATSVANSVQYGLGEHVRAATVESERRISAHVDEAVLALAEALLRRRRPGPAAPVAADPRALAPPSPVQAGSAAADEPVVPGVAELAAVPSVGLDPTDQQAEAELEGRDVLAQDGPQGADAASQAGRDPTAAQTEAKAGRLDALAQASVTDAAPSPLLDPADAQADAELEGRDVLAQDAVTGPAPSAGLDQAEAEAEGRDGLAQDADGDDHPDAAPSTGRTDGPATGGGGRRRPWWRPGE